MATVLRCAIPFVSHVELTGGVSYYIPGWDGSCIASGPCVLDKGRRVGLELLYTSQLNVVEKCMGINLIESYKGSNTAAQNLSD